MKQHRDTVWQRRGISWIWHPDALAQVAKPGEVWSLRQFLRSAGQWTPDQALPSHGGDTLVVAGLDACLDLLHPEDAEIWLSGEIKEAILAFQDAFSGETALLFWLPEGKRRFHINPATDAVTWRCAAPHAGESLDFGRVLWGEAHEYPQEILLAGMDAPVGLFHRHIS
jgi:hypothetical protein